MPPAWSGSWSTWCGRWGRRCCCGCPPRSARCCSRPRSAARRGQLHDCPVDEVKLDRSFTQAPPLPSGEGRTPVAAAVIQLAQALRLHAVAEGVETPEQAERLRSLGYRSAQGYHFARPVSAAQLTEWMTDRAPTRVAI
ncbi:EAL domain-containing protein [Dactylosporangium sp. NPDC000521]|uniref:EAL domain-containing protein n=1 Tax=Dactylosporangium sp. NPDC000521 TaxID=3363975 RepID=UPI0036CD26B3